MREMIFKVIHFQYKEELSKADDISRMINSLPVHLKTNFQVELYYKMITA